MALTQACSYLRLDVERLSVAGQTAAVMCRRLEIGTARFPKRERCVDLQPDWPNTRWRPECAHREPERRNTLPLCGRSLLEEAAASPADRIRGINVASRAHEDLLLVSVHAYVRKCTRSVTRSPMAKATPLPAQWVNVHTQCHVYSAYEYANRPTESSAPRPADLSHRSLQLSVCLLHAEGDLWRELPVPDQR